MNAITGDTALEMLKEVGFEAIRHVNNGTIVKRGALKLTLPPANVLCNAHQMRIVEGIYNERKTPPSSTDVPLMVTHNGEVYAVVEDRGTKWQLQDLNDGSRLIASKDQCETYEFTPPTAWTAEEKEVPEFSIHKDAIAPEPSLNGSTPEVGSMGEALKDAGVEPKQYAPLSPLTNPSDQAALLGLSRRRLEFLNQRKAQLTKELADIDGQWSAAINFIKSLGFNPDELPEMRNVELEPKRTVLPPTTGKRGGRGTAATPKHVTDKIRMAFIDAGKPEGWGSMPKIKAALRKLGVAEDEIPSDSTIKRYTKE